MKKQDIENMEEKGKSARCYKNKYCFKCFLLCLPFLLLVVLYAQKDPFLVLRKYKDYDHSSICLNEGAVGWYKYKLFRDKAHYDSFIMGTSCTMAYRCEDWNKHIHARPYRFFSNSEGLADLYLKLSALDKQPHQPIKNLLLVLENGLLTKDYMQTDAMHIMPPEISKVNKVTYQMAFLQNFFNPLFLAPYLKYEFTHRYEHSMKGVVNQYGISHTGYNNNAIYPNEYKIRKLKESYWKDSYWKELEAQGKHPKEFPRAIFHSQISYLNKIKAICNKHHTNIKIVFGPYPEKCYINRQDIAMLKQIFGNDNVFDFSHPVNSHLFDKHNFYDKAHYRITVGKKIIDTIYANETNDETKDIGCRT